jgi:hypothetical protein
MIDPIPDSQNEGCFGERAAAYFAAPLVAQMYFLGKNNDDSLKDLIAEAVGKIIEAANADDREEDILIDVAELIGVVAVGTITLWYMSDEHMCEQIGAAAEKAAQLIEVTAEDVAGSAR